MALDRVGSRTAEAAESDVELRRRLVERRHRRVICGGSARVEKEDAVGMLGSSRPFQSFDRLLGTDKHKS